MKQSLICFDSSCSDRTDQSGEDMRSVRNSARWKRINNAQIRSHSISITSSSSRLTSTHQSTHSIKAVTIMVRNYKRKTVTNYTQADLEKALEAIQNSRMMPRAASKQFNIPVATLYARSSGIRGNGPRGGKTILSSEEEAFLVHTIEIFQKWQLPLLRRNVIDIAHAYMTELGKKFKQSSPLTEWFISFMARHPELKLTKCENLEKARSVSCTPLVISE